MSELPASLAPGREAVELPGGILSAMPEHGRGAPYDRKAAAYDRLIPARAYNRLLWGTHPDDYRRFAQQATKQAEGAGGPMLEIACGTAVFTAEPYRAAPIEAVLSDLSVAMLERARDRLASLSGPGRVHLVQADAADLPFAPRQFPVVAAMGCLHVFDDLPRVLASVREQVAPGGTVFLSGLVAETRIGTRYLRVLHRAGEVSVPMRMSELTQTVARSLSADPESERRGSMAYLTVRTGG